MFAYYFDLALRSFKRNKVLTALMVLAIALGIGASMTTLTVFRVLSGDPLPEKSGTLFHPQLDPRTMDGYIAGEEPDRQLTRYDAQALLRDARGDRQAVMTGGGVGIQPTSRDCRRSRSMRATPPATSSRCSPRPSCMAPAGARPRTTATHAWW
jgi:putative ABC transport system permease protein